MLFELIASKGFARMIRFIPASTAVAAVLTFGCDTEDNAATTTDSGTGSYGTGGTATNDSSTETAGAGGGDGSAPVCNFDAAADARAMVADSIIAEMTAAGYSTSWSPFYAADFTPRLPFVASAHGKLLAAWVNPTGEAALTDWEAADGGVPDAGFGQLEMPDGTIIVKHNYDLDSVLMGITIMKKDLSLSESEYPGQWFWIKTNPALEVLTNSELEPAVYMGGHMDGCVNCHNGSSNEELFPPEVDGGVGGVDDALLPYDMVVGAYCKDPASSCEL